MRYRKNLASLERVSSENKGKQPKGKKIVQQMNKKTGTRQIKTYKQKENTVAALVSDHLGNSK